jgi:hypothetical protein
MKKIEELKLELFQKLGKYPKIESFFKDSFQERIKVNDNWAENILIQNVLDEKYTQEDALHTLLESISDDKQNYEVLREKLTPNDDYDRKMLDVLAELNGYYHLKKSKFTEIAAIPQSGTQKTPDFSAKFDNQSYLFEVKNIRAPVDIEDVLFDKINERKILVPPVYDNLRFDIKISNSWDEVYFTGKDNETLKLRVLLWLEKLFYFIESGEKFEIVSNKVFDGEFLRDKLRIQCNLTKDNHSVMIGYKYGFEIGSHYKKQKLMPFIKKVVRIVDNGISQLLEYDQQNHFFKYVLLNWQKPGYIVLLEEKEFYDIIKSLDNLVKNISENLYVKLLNVDDFP